MTEELSYPSGKLGAITRVKNKCTKFIEENPLAEAEELISYKEELTAKITAFNNACLDQLKMNVPDEDLNDFETWVKKHRKGNVVYMSKLEIKIAEAENDYEDSEDDKDDEEDGEDDYKNDEEEDDKDNDKDNNRSDVPTSELIKHLTKMQLTNELPRNEPETFSGDDITEYQTFLLTFEMMIERKCTSFSDKFFYLLKYTNGEAHELVKSCHSSNIKESYVNAKAILNKHYGNEYKIAQQYLSKLNNWPQIRGEDPAEMKRFATFLISCANLMKKMSSLNQLNSVRDIKDILLKLPWNLRTHLEKLLTMS